MQIYCTDIELYATIYVVAESFEDAQRLIKAKIEEGNIDINEHVSSCQFDDPNMPKISFSPDMTITSKQEIKPKFIQFVLDV